MSNPNSIEEPSFDIVPKGYDPEEVDEYIEQLLVVNKRLYNDNVEFKDKINMLNKTADYYRSMEKTLHSTLILAEKTAEEAKENASVNALQIEKEAKLMAEEFLRGAKEELFKINEEISRLKNSYELMKTRVKLLLYAEIELLDKNEILNEKEEKPA